MTTFSPKLDCKHYMIFEKMLQPLGFTGPFKINYFEQAYLPATKQGGFCDCNSWKFDILEAQGFTRQQQ